MFLFGQKRQRHSRTHSVRGPESGWDALWGKLKDRSLLGRIGLCLLAVLILLVVVPSWWIPFPYREGQSVPNGVVASIDFEVVDHEETYLLRENAADAAPFVFENNPEKLDALPANFEAAVLAIDKAESIADLPEEIRRDFGLNGPSPDAPEGFRTPEERFAALNAAVAELGQKTTKQQVDDLVFDLSTLIEPLKASGIIPKGARTELGISYESRLKVVPTKEAASTAATTGETVLLIDVDLPDLLRGSAPKSVKWGSSPSVDKIKPLVTTWILNQYPATLRFDQLATEEGRATARASIPDVENTYPKGGTLISPGSVLDANDIALLTAEYEKLKQQATFSDLSLRIAVVFVLLTALAALNGYYLYRNEPNVVKNIKRLIVYLTAIVVAVALARLLSFDPWRASVIPIVATVMVFAIAYNQVFAALTGFTLCLIVTLATTMQLSQFVVLMTTVATAVLPLTHVSSRTTLIKSGFIAGLAYLMTSVGVSVLESQGTGVSLQDLAMLKQSLKGAAWCLFAGYFVAGSLPFIESTFGVITDISLLEMSDPSHPLLQELVQRAPGTYNHSISVASIAEAAADSIGANGLLVRVGAYFHDIGKMMKPQYFIENVQAGDESRHRQLAPAMSTLIIIGHVKDGVDLAEQYNLPQQFIDFIEQHHGTTLVEYFFHEATKQAGESPDRKTNAEESSFRYPGPKPQTKEAGVMMIADACESASRTLTDPTPKRLETLVHELAMKRLLDGQFDECSLTLREIATVEKSLVKSLIGIYHGRIKYPEARTA
ncbi:MAG: HDIG domain-containing protein [Planctomycetaceae bacterium]|nr:HDIG domain-containing protein [Planctomycetaceae bacterium]